MNYVTIQNPFKLLTPLKFDVMAKYIYGKYRDMGINSSWHEEEVYKHHLAVWNNFDEYGNPNKKTFQAFKEEFHSILDNIRTKGFDPEVSRIWIEKNGNVINGSHRLASCLLYNKPVIAEVRPEIDGQMNCSYYYLGPKNDFVKTGLSRFCSDAMATQYAELKKNLFVLTMFPKAQGNDMFIRNVLQKCGRLVYEKPVNLTPLGLFGIISVLYEGEPWVGNWSNGFSGFKEKVQLTYSEGPTRFFLFEVEKIENLRLIKETIRRIYGIGNHSCHINDTYEQTLRIVYSVFNDNSLHFLNNRNFTYNHNFELFLKKAREKIPFTKREKICFDGSTSLAAYGLRDCKDFDYLSFKEEKVTDEPGINIHNEEAVHYTHSVDDIVFNPKLHFYCGGLKFATLNVIKEMKQKRAEVPKDLRDIELIKRIPC